MKNFLFVILFYLFMSHTLTAQSDSTGSIIVKIKNIRTEKGMVYVSLYNSAKGFPGKPEIAVIGDSTKVKNKEAEVIFKDVSFGKYGVSVFHDENSNHEMDTNFMGIPKEGFGASNDAKGLFGPPSYDDAEFKFDVAEKTIIINMQYF